MIAVIPHFSDCEAGVPARVIHEETAADQREQQADEPGKTTWAAGMQLFPEHGPVAQCRPPPEPPPAPPLQRRSQPAQRPNPAAPILAAEYRPQLHGRRDRQDKAESELQTHHPGDAASSELTDVRPTASPKTSPGPLPPGCSSPPTRPARTPSDLTLAKATRATNAISKARTARGLRGHRR